SLGLPMRAYTRFRQAASRLTAVAPERVWLGIAMTYGARSERSLAAAAALARDLGITLLAHNDVHYHCPERRALFDVLTCIREKCTIDNAGKRLLANAEFHLKDHKEMVRLFKRHPQAITATQIFVSHITFSLDELRYHYPDDAIGGAGTPQDILTRLAFDGARQRYPDGIPDKVQAQIAYELKLIGELDYAPYFLTVWDITQFARHRQILYQGRGSAANSAVCYVLGITAVDPARMNLLFERFISTARDEPPDIDVDFEHERREEIIQYIYEKYGRHRAGLAATVITYRGKSAIRDVGKALGLSLDMVGILAGNLYGWGAKDIQKEDLRALGLDPSDPRLFLALNLARELYGFPRHLSQHVGGFVITRGLLEELVPIGNAAMDERTFIEWDKDDLSVLGILKIDILALGMLSCIAKAFALVEAHHGCALTLASVPAECPRVYDMLQKGDSIGVFQVESRAQMSMLPRLKPKEFNDLVIEVAIVRPGPIQGDMVHPYLRRREGREPVDLPRPELRTVLEFTLGVPLFQEQAMQIAIVAAGFTPAEADQLRRAMAAFRRSGTIPKFRDKFVSGMTARGYEHEFAERCFHQIEGFADYGFPMSHAASFALLVYVSAYLRAHYPAAFLAAILNSQPMGFYAPAQLVRDAREHGVVVRPPDVNASAWDNTLEDGGVRLGFRQIKGFREADAIRLAAARHTPFCGVRDLAHASGLGSDALRLLAEADCFGSLGLTRREALWAVRGLDGGALPGRLALPELPLFAHADAEMLRREATVSLPAMGQGEEILQDYRSLRLSLKAHPLTLLRPHLPKGILPHAGLAQMRDGQFAAVAGLVLVRQRPGTAKGVIFLTLEDETGSTNIVVWPHVFERYRRVVLGARLLEVRGRVQRQGLVLHIVADHMVDLSGELNTLYDEPLHASRSGSTGTPAGLHRHPRNVEVIPKSRDFR
ncbi:MAG: error-prone DNA polymerase, partial [Alphaproteobacteria bacterium]|nr:error-prone DNA polymerase [Alphaproteobacteria bacterium]